VHNAQNGWVVASYSELKVYLPNSDSVEGKANKF